MNIATPYAPRTRTGHEVIERGIALGPNMGRAWLAQRLRVLRHIEGGFAARHCLAWLDWIGCYPLKEKVKP